jgi:2'-5' RNA ligase
MPRLFYAIDLPQELKNELSCIAPELKALGRHIRPVSLGSYHLTMLFLGDQVASSIVELERIGREAVANARPCRLTVGPIGFFPRVSYLTLTGETETLSVISVVLRDLCSSYLEQPDTKPFRAHVTLARHKKKASRAEKEKISEMYAPFEGMQFTSDELVLYESELTPSGAIYTAVDRFKFGAGPL